MSDINLFGDNSERAPVILKKGASFITRAAHIMAAANGRVISSASDLDDEEISLQHIVGGKMAAVLSTGNNASFIIDLSKIKSIDASGIAAAYCLPAALIATHLGILELYGSEQRFVEGRREEKRYQPEFLTSHSTGIETDALFTTPIVGASRKQLQFTRQNVGDFVANNDFNNPVDLGGGYHIQYAQQNELSLIEFRKYVLPGLDSDFTDSNADPLPGYLTRVRIEVSRDGANERFAAEGVDKVTFSKQYRKLEPEQVKPIILDFYFYESHIIPYGKQIPDGLNADGLAGVPFSHAYRLKNSISDIPGYMADDPVVQNISQAQGQHFFPENNLILDATQFGYYALKLDHARVQGSPVEKIKLSDLLNSDLKIFSNGKRCSTLAVSFAALDSGSNGLLDLVPVAQENLEELRVVAISATFDEENPMKANYEVFKRPVICTDVIPFVHTL